MSTDGPGHEAVPQQAQVPPEAVPAAPAPGAAAAGALPGMIGNRAFSAAVGRQASAGTGDGLLPGGAVHPDVAATLASRRGAGSPLPPAIRDEMGTALGDDLSDVRVHTDPQAQQLADSVAARAFTRGTDVYFGTGEFNPSGDEGRRLLAHELAHVPQQRGAPEAGPLTVSEPGDAFEREADDAASAIMSRSPMPAAADAAAPVVARNKLKAAVDAVKGAGSKFSAAYKDKLQKVAGEKASEMWDNRSSALQGPPAAIQAAQALTQGQNGVAPASLPAKAVSPEDQNKLKQIIQFELINAYCDKLLALHPELAIDAPATEPQPAPAPAPDQKGPTGAPTVDDVDHAVLDGVVLNVQAKVEAMWKKGAWPEGHEYIWGEGDGHTADTWSWDSDWVGVTGSIAFSNLTAQAMTATPALGKSAEKLGLAGVLASPGALTVRMIVGGGLVRGAAWTNSLFDNLAVNCSAGTPTSNGPGNSVAIQVESSWLWDDNQTAWDFIISVNEDGTPVVEDRRSGKPKDSSMFAPWQGEGGTHSTLIPKATLEEQKKKADAPAGGTTPAPTGTPPAPTQTPPAPPPASPGLIPLPGPGPQDQRQPGLFPKRRDEAVLARTPAVVAGPVIQREPISALGAAIGSMVVAASGDGAAAIAGGIQAAAAIATTGKAFAQGQDGVQKLTLPAMQMSAADTLKLKQIIQFRIIDEYCKRWLASPAGKAFKEQNAPTPTGPPAPPGKDTPAPAPAPKEDPKPAAPTGGPTAAAIDQEIMNAVKNQVQMEIDKAWKKAPAEFKEYIWGEGGGHTADTWSWDSDWVGATGAIAFSGLYGQSLEATPTLSTEAQSLVRLESPGPLVVRMLVGGTLDKSGSWTNSLIDSLAVNIPPPTITEDGPDSSIVVRIGTEWLWDDNTTVWDFAITIDKSGKPLVTDAKSGTPKDSRFLAWGMGEGGKHQRVGVGGPEPKVAVPGGQNEGREDPRTKKP